MLLIFDMERVRSGYPLAVGMGVVAGVVMVGDGVGAAGVVWAVAGRWRGSLARQRPTSGAPGITGRPLVRPSAPGW